VKERGKCPSGGGGKGVVAGSERMVGVAIRVEGWWLWLWGG